ncbi:MAG TPA: zinc ribbon domain-containing protein [Aldersonia sp.]
MTGRADIGARRDEASGEWFDGLAEGRLLLRSCPHGHASRPEVLACDVCGSADLGWTPAEGRGTVVALATDHSGGVATLLGIIELVEGPWLITRIEGRPLARGEAAVVRVVFPVEGEPYPVVTAAD